MPATTNQDFNPNPSQDTLQNQWEQLAYSDPATMAFLRSMGASDEVARAEAAQKINSARTAQGNLPQEYADLLGQGLRKISDQFENQGMYSSSARLRTQNERQGELQGQMLSQRNAYADQIGGAQTSLAKQLATGQMERADRMAAGADRVAQDAAASGMNVLPPSYLGKTTTSTKGPR